jgi:hypothetical protein
LKGGGSKPQVENPYYLSAHTTFFLSEFLFLKKEGMRIVSKEITLLEKREFEG